MKYLERPEIQTDSRMCCTTKEIKIAYNIDEGFGCYDNALRKCLLYARNSVRGVVSQFEIDFVPKLGDTYYMFAANFNNPTIAISMESRLVLRRKRENFGFCAQNIAHI